MMRTRIFSLFCFVSTFLTTCCWVLRLACKDEVNFDVEEPGYALENAVLDTFTSPYLGKCIDECVKHSSCKSINFKESGINNCEINSKIKQTANSIDFKIKAGWTYYSTLYNTSKIGSFCEAMNPCRVGELCIDTCDCPFHQCIRCGRCLEIKYEQHCEGKDLSQATTNIALRKPATASSHIAHGEIQNVPSLANDGVVSGHTYHCAITNNDLNPWWMVDLGARAFIAKVAVMSRNDGYHYRINPFDIRVGDNGENGGLNNPYCVESASLAGYTMQHFQCATNTCGRFVTITLKKAEHLQLGEVQVYGVY